MGRADETEDIFPRGNVRGSEFRRRREGREGNGVKNPNGREAIPVLLLCHVARALDRSPFITEKEILPIYFCLIPVAAMNIIGCDAIHASNSGVHLTYISVIALALIQGITEFLPVSSSGHLVIAQHFLGWSQDNVLLDVVLHLGTAVAIGVVFWKDILSLFRGLVSSDPLQKKFAARYIGFIAIGSLPAVLAGFLLKDFFEKMFLNPRATGLFFFVTALFLFASLRKAKNPSQLTVITVLIIGLAQALAILPGVSRSGTTIATALILGIERKEAGRFSFLLGLPAILGAALLEFKGISATVLSPGLIFAAFGISLLVGLVALKLLLDFIRRGRLFYFGFYLVALGLACLIFFG